LKTWTEAHVGVDERRDGNAAIGRAPELLGEHHGRERIHLGTAVFGRIADAEEAERAHTLEHLARHEAGLLPGVGVRLDLLLDEAPDLVAQHLVLGREEGRASLLADGGMDVHEARLVRARSLSRRSAGWKEADVSRETSFLFALARRWRAANAIE